MIAAVFAAALVGALLLQRDERDDVSASIRQLDEAQAAFALRYRSINQAYERLQVSPEKVAEEFRRLRRTARSLTTIRRRAAQVDAPTQVAELKRLVIALLKLQEALAHELVRVADYVRNLQSVERPITRANARLAASLRDARTREEQAGAFGRYASELSATAQTLSEIEPPSVLTPSHTAYVGQLRRQARSSADLGRAVGSGESAAIAAAGAQLRQARAKPTGTARAQQRTIDAYNGHITRIRSLDLAVEEERRRLERALGN